MSTTFSGRQVVPEETNSLFYLAFVLHFCPCSHYLIFEKSGGGGGAGGGLAGASSAD